MATFRFFNGNDQEYGTVIPGKKRLKVTPEQAQALVRKAMSQLPINYREEIKAWMLRPEEIPSLDARIAFQNKVVSIATA